ncbi:hypothetical protein Tco_1471092, partial [Tanacetum coccineum]
MEDIIIYGLPPCVAITPALSPEEPVEYINSLSWSRHAFYLDDDEEYTIAITPDLPTEEPDNSLSIGDEHLDTIPAIESDEVIKSSGQNLVPIPSEFEDFSNIESECDVPVCDDSMTFSNPLFDSDDDFSSSDDESFSDEDGDIHLVERLFYDNSSPRPPEELNSTESFPPSHIPVEDSDPFMEEIDLFLASDESIPSGIDSDYSDSEGDNLFLERLLHDDPTPLPDIPS